MIFIHIPKCAGSSIEYAFNHIDNYEMYDRKLFGPDHRPIRAIEQGYSALDALSNYGNFTELRRRWRAKVSKKPNPMKNLQVTTEQYNDFFKYSFVRNPWDRAWSMYKHIMREEHKQRRYKMHTLEDTSFKTFLNVYAGKKDLQPQTYWLKNFKGEIPLDFIGRFENLQEDFEIACAKMSQPILKLPHIYKGNGTDYRQFYDSQLVDLVQKVYEEEIKLFGYKFE